MMDLARWSRLWDEVVCGWVAGDGFSGVAHPIDGRYMFLHGDTLWMRSEGAFWTRNSATVFDPEVSAIFGVDTGGDDFIPAEYGEGWFWHGDMMWDGPDLWVIPQRATTTVGGWGFTEVRPRDLIQLAWPSFNDPRFICRYPIPFGDSTIDWGASLVRAGDAPWIYVYGTHTEPGWFGHEVYVARVRSGHLTDEKYWRFYAGVKPDGAIVWSSSEALAMPVIPHEEGPAGVFSSDVTAGGQFRLTSKLHGDFGDAVTIWQSMSPVGPFGRRHVWSVPWSSSDQTYGAFAHPGLAVLSNGRRMISVNHNTDAGLGAIVDNPKLYRPTWHEVLW